MIGKHIMIRSFIEGRYVARTVIGETNKFWIVRSPPHWHTGETYEDKKSKEALSVIADYATLDEAVSNAKELTERMAALQKKHNQERADLVALYSGETG